MVCGADSVGVTVKRASMSCSTPSQMWGSLSLPRFLFKGGSLTLMYMASLMVLVMPCDSLSHYGEFFQFDEVSCSLGMVKDGGGALRCFLYHSPKFLPVSPMYSMVHSSCHICIYR